MTGGLLQMVSSGKQDVFLTNKPEITFFKKVFRRHTNFAVELNRITTEQQAQYNSIVTFIINIGDSINRCYIEVDLPNLSFSDSLITNSVYIQRKKLLTNNCQTSITKWLNYYNNLKGFCDIEIQLYRQLNSLLQSENVTTNNLKDNVNRFNLVNKTTKDNYKNKIDPAVYPLINISGYINSISLLLTNIIPNPNPALYIEVSTVNNTINTMYNSMITNLTYYNNKVIFYQNSLNSINSMNIINFNYSQYVGHNYFEYISLQIGGQEITRYTNEILHINMMHHIEQENMQNYFEMIGNVPILTTFNSNTKGNYKLLIPLLFWFNKDTGSSLPLVALQYSTVTISMKISPINKIICFENYELMYDTICALSVDTPNGFILNKNLIYKSYSFDINNKKINYACLLINNELLQIAFPDLTTTEINILLTTAGSVITLNEITSLLQPELTMQQIQVINGTKGANQQYVINKNQWVAFMINITNPIYSTLAPKVGQYYPYINFNAYYSLIPLPVVNMVCESVYLDDVERSKFANSKLEFVVENFYEDIYKIPSQLSFDCELDFLNPVKELVWFFQPQIYIDGLTQYGQNISLLFDTTKYFKNNLFTNQTLRMNQYDVLQQNIDMNFYTNTLSYKYLNNVLPDGVYYNSFCLFPEETQPSGSINMTEIKAKLYQVNLNSSFLTEYKKYLTTLYGTNTNLINSKLSFTLRFIAKSYDLFVVTKGTGRLLFSI